MSKQTPDHDKKQHASDPSLTLTREISHSLQVMVELTRQTLATELTAKQAGYLDAVCVRGEALLHALDHTTRNMERDIDVPLLHFARVSLAALTDSTISLATAAAQSRNIDFEIVRKHNSPNMLIVEEQRLQQLLLLMLDWAVMHAVGTTISVATQVTVAKPDTIIADNLQPMLNEADTGLAQLQVTIADKGYGPGDATGKSDDPHSDHHSGEMELTACKLLCAALGGEIALDKTTGRGFSIAMTVPCGLAAKPINTQRSATSPTAQGSNDPSADRILARAGQDRPLSILLAEDSEVSRLLLQAQLDQIGYRADVVANGEEVLRALSVRFYDVVLMDIRMPVLDGFETTARLRNQSDSKQPYVIAVTGGVSAADQEKLEATGINAYLLKPVSLPDLISALDRAYQQKQLSAPVQKSSARTSTTAVVVLDLETLYAQLGSAADSLLRRVIPVFIREFPARRDGLMRAFEARDAEAFASLCHSLKGSSRSVGATQLADEFARHETEGYAGALPAAEELDALLELCVHSIKALDQELEKLGTAPDA